MFGPLFLGVISHRNRRRGAKKQTMAEESKRRKIEKAPSLRVASSPAARKTGDETSSSSLMVAEPHGSNLDLRIQQARNFAVAQAQQEGCMGNYRIFDSPFGNFLVPVIPSGRDLADGSLP